MNITDEFLRDVGFTQWGSNGCVFELHVSDGKKILLWKQDESQFEVSLFGLDLREPVKERDEVLLLLRAVGFKSPAMV